MYKYNIDECYFFFYCPILGDSTVVTVYFKADE